MVADEEKFQNVRILAKQQTQLQPSPAFENGFSQPSDGDSGVRVGITETIGNDLKSCFDTGKIRIAQFFEPRAKACAEQDGEFRHASIFP